MEGHLETKWTVQPLQPPGNFQFPSVLGYEKFLEPHKSALFTSHNTSKFLWTRKLLTKLKLKLNFQAIVLFHKPFKTKSLCKSSLWLMTGKLNGSGFRIHETNEKASTVVCSVVQQLGSGRSSEKHKTEHSRIVTVVWNFPRLISFWQLDKVYICSYLCILYFVCLPSGLKAVTSDFTMTTLRLCLNTNEAGLSSTSNSSNVLPNFLRLQIALTTSVAVIRTTASFGHNTDKCSAQETPEIPPPMIRKVQVISVAELPEDILTLLVPRVFSKFGSTRHVRRDRLDRQDKQERCQRVKVSK